MDKTQTILAMLLVAIVFGVGGYAVQNFKIADLNTEINGLDARNDVLSADLNDISAVSEAQIQQIANLNGQIDSIGKEIESLNNANVAKDDVIKGKDIALQKSITEKELAEQRATELEQKIELIEQEEIETAAGPNGVVFDEIELNTETTKTIDGYDTDKLYDGKISFDGDTYYVRETIEATIKPTTSLLNNEFKETVYLTNENNAVKYTYLFETPLKQADVCDDKNDDCNKNPFTIEFLGKKMDIVEISESEIKTKEGDLKYIKLGESVTYEDKTVTLTTLGTDFVYIDVNDETGYIKEGHTRTINGLDVYLSSTGTVSGFEGAVVVLGSNIYQIYKTDSYDFADDFLFTIEYDTVTNELDSLTVTYEPERLYLDNDDGFAPLKKDESINFLDYFSLNYLGVTEVDYTTYTMTFKDYNSSITNTIKIKTSDSVIKIGTDRVNEFYFDASKTVYYKDANNERKQNVLGNVIMKNGESETTITSAYNVNNKYHINFTTTDGTKTDIIRANTKNYVSLLQKEKAEPRDIVYMITGKKIGSEDNSVVTNYGTIVSNPEDNSENDKVVLIIPDKQVFAELSIC